MQIQLDRRFRDKAKGRFGKYEFEVGILKDGPHRKAAPKSRGTKSYAGGPARKLGQGASGQKISTVSKYVRKQTDYLRKPFQTRTADIIKFAEAFFDLAFGRTEARRALNLLQAVVRNPILRGDYGSNARSTIRAKGFNRYMIDTAQMFRAITARVKVTKRV